VASVDPLFVAENAELGLTWRMVVAVRSGRELNRVATPLQVE
jgi:hypothetical protein